MATLTPSGNLQVTRDGVVHMAFHPRSDAIILAAGDKGGRLGIWHLDHDSFEVSKLQTFMNNVNLDAHHGLSAEHSST